MLVCAVPVQIAEDFLLEFHRRHPGCTSQAFAQGGQEGIGGSSYELLVEVALAEESSIVDLGCGDGHLLRLLGAQCGKASRSGIDISESELSLARSIPDSADYICTRAQKLPFAQQSQSLVVSHFAFHLMNDLESVVAEIARILIPGARFAALVGGGPKLESVFEIFLDIVEAQSQQHSSIPRLGEMRSRTIDGLGTLFGPDTGFASVLQIEDFYVDFGGSLDDVWRRLSLSYELHYWSEQGIAEVEARFRREVRERFPGYVPCEMAVRRVVATRSDSRQ